MRPKSHLDHGQIYIPTEPVLGINPMILGKEGTRACYETQPWLSVIDSDKSC